MTQHPTQDSQSELRNAIEAYKRYPYGTKEYPHITGIELLEVVEAYVTTRVKEAERLARLSELSALDKSEIANQSMKKMQIRIKGRIEALTTTTNGKSRQHLYGV